MLPQTYVGTRPAAGAEVSVRIPTPGVYQVLAVRLRLVTSAAVADRLVTLRVFHQGVEVYRAASKAVQVASTTRDYVASPHGVLDADTVAGIAYLPLPVGMVLTHQSELATSTSALQGGDQFDAPILYVVQMAFVREGSDDDPGSHLRY